MPALLPITLIASHVVVAADAVPEFDVDQSLAERGALAGATKAMPVASSSRSGLNTARRNARTACGFRRAAHRRAMSNC